MEGLCVLKGKKKVGLNKVINIVYLCSVFGLYCLNSLLIFEVFSFESEVCFFEVDV